MLDCTDSLDLDTGHISGLKFAVLAFSMILAVGTGAATDLNNIETITPSGSNPINITGELAMNGNNIDNIGSITNYYGSLCDPGNVSVGLSDSGTPQCVDVTGEVQGDFVNTGGDSMTGNLDMSSNAILNVDWANSDNPNTDNQQLSISGDTISLDNGGSVTIQDDTIPDDQQLSISGHTISLDNGGSVTVPDNTIADDQGLQTSRSSGTVTIDIDNGNGASFTDNYEANTDNQQLSISGDTISLDNGGSVTIQDDYEANTDASTKCSGNDYLAGDGTCNVDSYQANTDNQDLSNVVGQGGALSSGQTIDASSGAFRLPVGADSY